MKFGAFSFRFESNSTKNEGSDFVSFIFCGIGLNSITHDVTIAAIFLHILECLVDLR